MANPYMRDALMDEMEQNATTRPGQVKTPEPMRRAPTSAFPAADAGSSTFDPGWGIESNPTTTRSSETPRVDDPTTPVSTSPGDKGPTVPGTTTPPLTPSPTATPEAPAANAGQNRYAGFDTQRAQDPTTSAKDAFYAATQKAPPMPKDKAGSEVWFNQYIKSALESAGYKVDWVRGDKAFVRTRENPQGEEIDFNQGADSDASSVAWQSNMAGQTTGGTGTGAPGSAGANQAQLNGALSDPAVLEKINAQIDALMKQGMTMEQIMALFNTTQQGTGA